MRSTIICTVTDAEFVFCEDKYFENFNSLEKYTDELMHKKYLFPVISEDEKMIGYLKVNDACVTAFVEDQKRKNSKHGK